MDFATSTSSTPHKFQLRRRSNIFRKSLKTAQIISRKSIADKDCNDNYKFREVPPAISSSSFSTTSTEDIDITPKATSNIPSYPIPQCRRRQSSFYLKRNAKHLTNVRDHLRKKSKQQRYDIFNKGRCSIYRKSLKKSKLKLNMEFNDNVISGEDETVIASPLEEHHHTNMSNAEKTPSPINDNADVFEKLAELKISESPFNMNQSFNIELSPIKLQTTLNTKNTGTSFHSGSVIVNRKIPRLNIERGYYTKNISSEHVNFSSSHSHYTSCFENSQIKSSVSLSSCLKGFSVVLIVVIIIYAIFVY